MPKRKQVKKQINEVNEPAVDYSAGKIRSFNSFEEQEEYELKQMAALDPKQILEQLRKFINIAYGMHGYDPQNLPLIHSIRIIKNSDEHI
jgi:hypothetical protein